VDLKPMPSTSPAEVIYLIDDDGFDLSIAETVCKMPSSTVAIATVELMSTPSTSRAIEDFKKTLHNNEIKKKIDNFIEKWFFN
jgi:hypothetical protein